MIDANVPSTQTFNRPLPEKHRSAQKIRSQFSQTFLVPIACPWLFFHDNLEIEICDIVDEDSAERASADSVCEDLREVHDGHTPSFEDLMTYGVHDIVFQERNGMLVAEDPKFQ